jgi:ABC-type amino acid transport system permease subunit
MSEWFQKFKADFVLNFINDNRWEWLLNGLIQTLIITFFAVLLGIAIGVVIAIVRSTYDKNGESMKTRNPFAFGILSFFNAICNLYLTVIRGTPVVVQLMIMYFVIFASSTNSTMVAVLAFGINSGAYVAEIFRSGIMAIDKGQFEAGRSLGFGYMQTMWLIVFPQAFKAVLPALANEFVVLLKETSIAFYIGLGDLMYAGNAIRAATYSAFMPLVAVAVIYLIMVLALSKLVSILERRLRNSER